MRMRTWFEARLVRPLMKKVEKTVEPEGERAVSSFNRGKQSKILYMGLMALCALMIFLVPQRAGAQIGGTGTIEGSITDPQGAVVAGARVVAKNVDTGAEMARVTNADGRYSLSPLDAGTYTVTVTAQGFTTLLRQGVHVNGLQVLGMDMSLQLGAANVTVTVTAAPPPLETENATLGATMENDTYTSLPIEMGGANGVSTDQRRATDYAIMMPGATNNETKNNESDEPMVVNGYSSGTTMYIEGIPLESASTAGDPRFIWPAFSVETIDQFQLKTSGYSAEYQGIGVENFTVKQGTNAIHGTVYEIFRNTALDAAGFIPAQYPANYPDPSKAGTYYTPPEHMNEYGMTLGLPIWKNKIFLFGNYTGFRYTTLTKPQGQTNPTPAEQCGDFTALGVPIYDPTTQTLGSSGYSRKQFSGPTWTTAGCGTGPVAANVIPQNEISPIAQYLQKFMPAPSNSNITGNYYGSYNWGLNNWSTADRIDVHLNDRHSLAGIFAWGRQGLIGPAGSQTTNVAPLPYLYAKNYSPISKVAMLQDTYVINDSLVNQFKYGAAQYHSPDHNPTYGIAEYAATTAGITGLPQGQAAGSFPYEKFSGGPQALNSWGPQTGYIGNTNAFTLLDNLQWIHGRHAFTFGGQLEWMQYNYLYAIDGSTLATMNFSNTETAQVSGSTAKAASNGLPYASYLLGAVDSGSYTQYAPIAQAIGARYRPFAIYATDDWKLTPRLTVNAGLRWDVMPPFQESENRFSFLNPTGVNPVTGNNGILQFAGTVTDGCNCSTPLQTYYKNIGPRLGLAYQLGSKIVLRGSYGIYYGHGGGTSGGQTTLPSSAMELGFAASPNPVSPGDSLPAFYLNNSAYFTNAGIANTNFGTSTVAAPPVFNPAYATYYSTAAVSPYKVQSTLAYLDPKYGGRTPTFEGWSLGYQILVTKDMTATLSYVGNQGHFLVPTGAPRGYWSNQLDPQYLSLGTTLGATATSANTPNGLPYPTFNNKVSQALLAFPQYSGVTDQVAAVGNSNYNALQMFIQQRLSHGLTFMLSYTYSKTIDDVGTFRTGYAIPAGVLANSGKAWAIDRIERSLSTQDQPQNLVFTSTYDLPFGKDHIGGGNAIVRAIAGGWRFSDVFLYVSGNPLALTSSTCTNVVGQGTCMPAYNTAFTGSARQNGGWGHGATRDNLSTIQYINPAAFLQTAAFNGVGANGEYVLGDVARTAPDGLRAPSNYNIDASLRRTFSLWKNERVKFVFDAAVFNAVNHVWFGSPAATADGSIGSSVGSASLGVVSGQSNNPRQFQFAGHFNF
jgi:Carboxypeptidase regulatory-like domain